MFEEMGCPSLHQTQEGTYRENLSTSIFRIHEHCHIWIFLNGCHSLRYFYTAMTPIHGLPKFLAIGYVDDIPIDYYDSDLRKLIPLQRWMAECQDPEYWEQQTQVLRSSEHIGLTNIQTALNRTNQSGGIHTVQVMHGCELQTDGRSNGFHQEGWDGQDYISFDKEHMVWVTPVSWGLITKNKWDQDKARNLQRKIYLERTCIEWLKTYLKQGEKALKPIAPQMFLTVDVTSATESAQLSCLVTGFYPRDIEVILLKNGTPIGETYSTGILPNHNGTYQFRRWAVIELEDTATYSCQYEHGSKGVETRQWVEAFQLSPRSRQGTSKHLDVGIVAAVLVLIGLTIGMFVWKRRRKISGPDLSLTATDSGESP
ncbi:major histocompatibility complex class I-related gene protein-like isoform X2 [Stegostoma tigrinum]|uniref:major histocompatibility complex class I-related gene protein-like isoform X2 n=1 Tax=Stegostoma tigrinum TaxID=3053191 RepID=UPI00202B2772|nr:major histocompatibility complex class I-related gene protein-like isoform X2 [Stegostoma tigrinum]